MFLYGLHNPLRLSINCEESLLLVSVSLLVDI